MRDSLPRVAAQGLRGLRVGARRRQAVWVRDKGSVPGPARLGKLCVAAHAPVAPAAREAVSADREVQERSLAEKSAAAQAREAAVAEREQELCADAIYRPVLACSNAISPTACSAERPDARADTAHLHPTRIAAAPRRLLQPAGTVPDDEFLRKTVGRPRRR